MIKLFKHFNSLIKIQLPLKIRLSDVDAPTLITPQYCYTFSKVHFQKEQQGPDSHINFTLDLNVSVKEDIVFKGNCLSTPILLLLAHVYLHSQRMAHLRSPL